MKNKPNQTINQISDISRSDINDTSNINELNKNTSNSSQTEKKCGKKTKWIIISVIAAVVIAAAIVIVIIVTKKKDKKPSPGKIIDSTTPTSSPTETPTEKPSETPSETPTEKPSETPTQTPTEKPNETPTQTPTETEKISPTQTDTKPTSETTTILNTVPEQDKLQSEFKINTNKGDLKNIKVVQKSYDQSKFNDQIISTDTIRETNYDIFILSEEDAKGEDQLFYNKMYTGAISIANECYYSSKDECDYKELIDLKKIKEDPSKMRILEDNVNFKNIPLAICLFNITDNDFITSITCHKELPDMKKNEMLLDLYFFRSPAIERKNKTRDNITITKSEDERNNKKYIREQNGGLCNIHNNWGSHCTTDMNITTDMEGNLLAYDEEAITNIVYDEKNTYTKNKITNLVDHSESITKEDAEIYRKNLDKLLEKMKPYMEEDVQFPKEKFSELYNLIKYKNQEEDDDEVVKDPNARRRLTTADAIQYIRQKEIFHVDSLGVEVNLNIKLNPGLNTNAMSSHLNFSFDTEEHNLYKSDQLTEVQNIIDQLRALSRAGNYLATQLYDQISEKLEYLPIDMSIQLRSLYDLLKYYDLFEVFNSTLTTISYNKLPYLVIKLSQELVDKMSTIYYNIERPGKIKDYVTELRDAVYEFVNNSHALVDNIYNNLKELDNVLLTKSNPFTQITNYYLNNTSVSYVKMVWKSKRVFNTYFQKEFNASFPKVEQFIQMFEEDSKEMLETEREYLLDMYTRLMNGSYTIVGVSEADFEKVLTNLLNSYNYPYEIIEKIKEFILKEINIKDSGYYISNADIDAKNKTYASIYSEVDNVLEVLNNSDLIDKKFDEIMINFKDKYNDILRYMYQKKYEIFTLEEYRLKETLFTDEVKNMIETKIKEFTENILINMKRETEYRKEEKIIIDNFINENLEELNLLILELDAIVSEDALETIVNDFESSMNQSLTKLSNDIDNNVNLTEEYFDHFYSTIYDNEYLINVLRNYHVEEIPKIKYFSGYGYDLKKFEDEIVRKERTTTYLKKYNQIISMWNYTEKYLKNQLSQEILEDYKKIFNKIKESLQSLLNFDNLKNYTDLEDLAFYSSHSKIVENIQKRIDKYFSKEIFQAKYSIIIEKIKTTYKEVINEKRVYMKERHKSIKNLTVVDNKVYDFCIKYQRKICYGCTNCVWNTIDYGRFCIVLTPYEKNYLKLVKIAYEIMESKQSFNETLNEFYERINVRVTNYTLKIKSLEYQLTKVKNETLDDSFVLSYNYLSQYAEWVQKMLDTYFGNVIIKASYNYHQQQIKGIITNLLEDFAEKFKSLYKSLFRELNLNFESIKYTMYEFGLMGQAYQTIIRTGLIKNYFNSTVLFKISEFNYTITQYYQYFYKLVNNSYTYILANLPKEENEKNYLFIERKNKTQKYFDLMLENIYSSAINTTNKEYQLKFLKIEETNFFLMNSKIENTIDEIDEYIEDKLKDILDIELFHNSLEITQYSLTTRFYLENKEFGKLLEEIYEPLDQGTFFYLNFDKFKDMMIENWIFDGNDFSNIINDALYDSNKEIQNELNIKYEEYTNKIENEITALFSKDIEVIIKELYSFNIKDLNVMQILQILQIINEAMIKIVFNIQENLKKLDTTDNIYYAFSQIETTMKFYRDYILESVNNTLSGVLKEFYENVKKKVYEDFIDKNLNKYLEVVKEITDSEEFGPYAMMNSTYKIGQIVYNLTLNAIEKYKIQTDKKIYFKYVERHQKILKVIEFFKIKNSIIDTLDDMYKNEILSKLTKHNEKVGTSSRKENYDLDDATKSQINSTIETAMKEISKIILTTKGSNFKAEFECTFKISESSSLVIRPICVSLKEFLEIENEEQTTKINTYIQNTIIDNLDDFLENVLMTFGNEFFQRIIDYNINFKIIDLYSNLDYALGQHFLYYSALGKYTDDVKQLPKDLKYRLYRLNDLNYTIENKKVEIINLLEEKLSELVENLKDVAEDKYTLYLKENKIIINNFSPELLKTIDNNLVEIMPQINKIYDDALQKYLKENFLNAFTNALNEETDEMLDQFNKEKKRLKDELDFLFSEKIDEDLHEVNANLIKTFISIIDFYKFLRTFSLPEKLINSFRLYANTSIVPVIETFRTDLENLTYTTIVEDIKNRSKSILSIDKNEFLNKCRELITYFDLNYYVPILKAFENYTTPSYKENLLAKRDEFLNQKALRRLAEEEDKNLEIERQESKDVEETFEQIYQLVFNVRNYFISCFEYYDLLGKVTLYNTKVNIAYKTLKPWIKENRYSKNINRFLYGKLNQLYYILINYYANDKKGLFEKRSHMNTNIEKIYTKMISIRITTASTLNNEYKNILESSENFNITHSKNSIISDDIEYKHKSDHMVNKATATFSTIKEYTQFEFETFLKGGFFKTPYVRARIVDKSRPENLLLFVKNEFGFCGRKVFRYDIDFNDVNYTLTLNYNTKSNFIDITTFTDFDKYYYTSQMYELPDKYETENITYMGYTVTFFKQCYKRENRNLTDLYTNEVEAKNYNETMIIVG